MLQTMVSEICAGNSLERKIILESTNSVAFAFNAWIPLITYNTNYAPRFLVDNSVTVELIVCAACTLSLALYLQRRDAARSKRAMVWMKPRRYLLCLRLT
jgi:ACS family pantothenate transporter-like MFS transporter